MGYTGILVFAEYTSGSKSKLDVFFITAALMVGTAGLPHVIVRFFTVKKVSDARKSAGWALLFIMILYTTAPAIAVFSRTNMIETVNNKEYKNMPSWFSTWEETGLLSFNDINNDGKIQYLADPSKNELIVEQRYYGIGQSRNSGLTKLGNCISCSRRISSSIIYSIWAIVGNFRICIP